MSVGALAVDIGATKIAFGTIDSTGKIEQKIEVRIENKDSEQIWQSIEQAAQNLLQESKIEINGIGIASAGPIFLQDGTISPVNISAWRRFPILNRFKDLINSERVFLCGDAMAVANAEHKFGAGRGLSNFLGMVVSTGIGGGLIINDSLFLGDSGNSGFLGHQSIDVHGEECACGRKGCLESLASGPKMVEHAKTIGWNMGSDFVDLAESARQGNEKAKSAIDRGAKALAVGITNTLASIDVHHVVIGGGVTEAGEIFWAPLRKHLENESSLVGFLKDKIVVRQAQLRRDAGLIGASLLVLT